MIVTIVPKNRGLDWLPALAPEWTRPGIRDAREGKMGYITAPTCQGTNSLSP